MTSREMTRQYRLNQWTQIIRECRSSGQSVVAWCAENNINSKSYYYWLRQIRAAAFDTLSTSDLSCNPIVPLNNPLLKSESSSSENTSSSEIVLRLGSITLEIHNHASASLIENTLRAIQHVR